MNLTEAFTNGISLTNSSLAAFQAEHSRLLDQLINNADVAPDITENLAAEGLRLEALRKTAYPSRPRNAALRKNLRTIFEALRTIDPTEYRAAVHQATFAGEYTATISTKIYWSVLLGRPDSLSHLLQDARFPAGFVAIHTYQAFLAVGLKLLEKLSEKSPNDNAILCLIPAGLDFYEAVHAGTENGNSEPAIRRKLKKIGVLLAKLNPAEEYAKAVSSLRSLGGAWYFAPRKRVAPPLAVVPQPILTATTAEGIWTKINRENPELFELIQEAEDPDNLAPALQEIALTQIGKAPHLSFAAISYLIHMAFVLDDAASVAALFDLLRSRSTIFQTEHAQLLQEIGSTIRFRNTRDRYREFQQSLRATATELFAGDSAA